MISALRDIEKDGKKWIVFELSSDTTLEKLPFFTVEATEVGKKVVVNIKNDSIDCHISLQEKGRK